MTKLKIEKHLKDGSLVVDSRLIAQELGVSHEALIKIIKKYIKQIEQAFGRLIFENGVPDKSTENPPKFVYLNEGQANFIMLLSQNTPKAIQCKAMLVSQFSKTKPLLAERANKRKDNTSIYIERLQNCNDHIIENHLWSVFREGGEVILVVEKKFQVSMQQIDLLDSNIAKMWSEFRSDKDWAVESSTYTHKFQDFRDDIYPAAYQLSELPHFRRWLREEYIKIHLPKYLITKYGKRAVL